VVIDLEQLQVTRGSKPVNLTSTEFRLLHCLASHPNRPFSRQALIEAVWGYESGIGSDRTVDVHIRHLREKLEVSSLITSVEGEPVESPESFVETIQARQPGDRVSLEVIRSGENEPETIQITLGASPDDPQKAYLGVRIGMFLQYKVNPDRPGAPFFFPRPSPEEQPFFRETPEAPTS
jgi:hypothetical protein